MSKSKKIQDAYTYWEESWGEVKKFTPHEASPEIQLMESEGNVPVKIFYSIDAYRTTNCIIEESGNDEVAWLGAVRQVHGKGYIIEKIFLFEQTVSGGHCEIDHQLMGKFYHSMLKADPENKKLLNSILFWGHLHPGNMFGPSSQDETQMDVFSDNPFFIRGIFTRRGRCEFTFFDYARGIKIVDCPWELYVGEDEEMRQRIKKEMKEKVKNASSRIFGASTFFLRKKEAGSSHTKEAKIAMEEPQNGE